MQAPALLLDLARDLRHALRLVSRRPAHATAAAVTLGLGLGLCTAMFSVVDAVVLRPLPYANPDRLVTAWETYPHWRNRPVLQEHWDRIGLAWPDYEQWRKDQRAFEEVAVFAGGEMVMTGGQGPERLRVGRTSASLFSVLAVRPQLGRDLLPGEDGSAAARTALLSHGLWQRRLGGDPEVVGRIIHLDREPFTVIGVLPSSMRFAVEGESEPDLWIPIGSAGESLSESSHSYTGLARLRPDVTPEQAAAETIGLLRGDRPPESRGARLQPYHQTVVGEAAPRLLLVFGAAVLLLLIACVNVSALLVNETVRRGNEIVTRAALGASASRLLRQFVTETFVLSTLAALVGMAVAYATVGGLVALAPPDVSRLEEVAVDGRVLLFALAAAFVTTAVATIAPGAALLRSESRVASHHRTRDAGVTGRWAHGLVVGIELAVLTVLLTAAALLGRSLHRITTMEPGFQTADLLTTEVQLPESIYRDRSEVAGAFSRVTERIRAIPGVRSVSGSSTGPFSGEAESTSVGLEGRPENAPKPEAQRRVVLPQYLETLGIPLLAGRSLNETGVTDAPDVVVNAAMARRFWPDRDAVGQRISLRDRWYSVVGVADDVRDRDLRSAPDATYYVPQSVARETARRMSLVIRTALPAETIAPQVRAAVWAIDPGLPVSDIATLESLVARSLAGDRYRTLLVSLFAVAAAVLAAAGIFWTTLRVVTTRRRELGIRLALGARSGQILLGVLGRTSAAAAAGLTVGAAVSLASFSVLERFLYGIGPRDLPTHAATIVFLFVLTLGASWLPVRRAAHFDVAKVLRDSA